MMMDVIYRLDHPRSGRSLSLAFSHHSNDHLPTPTALLSEHLRV